MPHQAFKSQLIFTNKTRGMHFAEQSTGALQILQNIQFMQPMSELLPTEMNLTFGLGQDISTDVSFELYLTVADIDNLPEIGTLRLNNSWQSQQRWQVSTGAFTIPTKVLDRVDPRWFRAKAYRNLEVGGTVRRMALVLLGNTSTNIQFIAQGTISYSETLIQRTFGNDNAYDDIWDGDDNENDHVDDYEMAIHD